ncbi:MAG: porin family protein [bacterium]
MRKHRRGYHDWQNHLLTFCFFFLISNVMLKFSLFLTMLCILAIATEVIGQHKLHVGVIGGVNSAKLNIRIGEISPQLLEANPNIGDIPDTEVRFTFAIGGVLDYTLSQSICIRFEPMYMQKGTKATSKDSNGDDIESKLKLSYFEFPVLLKFNLTSGNVYPYVLAGPSLGYNLSAKSEVVFGEAHFESDLKRTTKSMDFGLSVGAGVSFSLGKIALFLEGRYTKGLINIDDTNARFTGLERRIKTKGVQLMSGFTMPLGG